MTWKLYKKKTWYKYRDDFEKKMSNSMQLKDYFFSIINFEFLMISFMGLLPKMCVNQTLSIRLYSFLIITNASCLQYMIDNSIKYDYADKSVM